MPQREILWNVPDSAMVAVYVLSGLSATWIGAWLVYRFLLWRQGQSHGSAASWFNGLHKLLVYLITHRTIARDRYAGWMHGLIFWGFVGLLIATTLIAIQHYSGFVFLVGAKYLTFSLAADLSGIAFCVGVAMALWRRRSERATVRLLPSLGTTCMLWVLLLSGLTGFVVEGLRIARDLPEFEVWSPAGYVLAVGCSAVGIHGDNTLVLHQLAWIGHALLVMILFAIVPVTLLRHILLGASSVLRSTGQIGVLGLTESPLTAVTLQNFRQVDLFHADACLTCGRCDTVCPAQSAGKPLSPRSIVLAIRSQLDDPASSLSERVSDSALWSCTTCNACDAACPVSIRIVDKIVNFRRGRVAEARIPHSTAHAFESMALRFNPFGKPNSARLDWARGLKVPVAAHGESVELLYWVGCGGAFEPAGKSVAQAMIRILNQQCVDYRVLGCRERCTGDPARRLGEETLWRELAEHNRQTIAEHNPKVILTHCPHCFNSMRNEYSQLGEMPPVVHHSQWIRDRLDNGTLKVRPASSDRITFHDPCYLSRANDEVESPRAVVAAVSSAEPIELERSGKDSFCCGAGGGQMWLDVHGGTRVENIRAHEVERSGAQTVATACPFCRIMLEAGRESLVGPQGRWRIKDIAELLDESLSTEGDPR